MDASPKFGLKAEEVAAVFPMQELPALGIDIQAVLNNMQYQWRLVVGVVALSWQGGQISADAMDTWGKTIFRAQPLIGMCGHFEVLAACYLTDGRPTC